MFLKFTERFITVGFSNVHPQLKKNNERRQISTVNDVFRYSLNMHWLSGIKLKHCRYYSKQRKHQIREDNRKQHTHTQKQTRKINKFELLFILVMAILFFFSPYSVVRPTQFFGIFQKKKKVTTLLNHFSLEIIILIWKLSILTAWRKTGTKTGTFFTVYCTFC